MACNENIIKNMANEVTRNCQALSIFVEPEFVMYMIELLLLNPKYGKLFAKTLNRNCLEYFVNECVTMINRGGTPINALKMQFLMRTNYDKLEILMNNHQDSIDSSLSTLRDEILDEEETLADEAAFKKLYRKIAIYLVLASGLGNPASVLTLKESMSALESVFTMEELNEFLRSTRLERSARLNILLKLAAGVRLFNRDCRKGGEMIQDLPIDLIDAGKACLLSLSNSLITVMQRVNKLTTAVEDCVVINEELKTMCIDIPAGTDLTHNDYQDIFDFLVFNRQYEVYIRRLLSDMEVIAATSKDLVECYKIALEDLHGAVKYKEAVPRDTVFPLFMQLWEIWKQMQNTMFLVSTVNKLMVILNGIQESAKFPHDTVEKMLIGKAIISDEERLSAMFAESALSVPALAAAALSEICVSCTALKERHITFLGFCVMCLNVGALVPSNMKVGVIKQRGGRYGFCNPKMAGRFGRNPQRYINEVIEYARNHVHVINLLNMEEMVKGVRDVEVLVEKYVPKTVVFDRNIQTLVHPVEEYLEHNYTWDLWEWKRRACQWATIVNCRTHSTQTKYSHWRSEIHCQTFEPRDKCEQTKKSTGINTNSCNAFLWGLRGQIGDTQHSMDLVPPHAPEKPEVKPMTYCSWPCKNTEEDKADGKGDLKSPSEISFEVHMDFYRPSRQAE